MPFVVQRKLSLDYLGEGWAEAYILFSPLSYNDEVRLANARKDREKIISGDHEALTKVSDFLKDLIKQKFIAGKGWDGSKLVDLTAEDVFEIPGGVVDRLIGMFDNSPVTPKKNS